MKFTLPCQFRSVLQVAVALLVAVTPLLTVTAQNPVELGVPEVVSRGPHERIIQRRLQETQANGQVVERISTYTEVATGMHYFDPVVGQYKDTEEVVSIVNGSALATHGPHKVIFAANPNSVGAIDLETPDGKRFRSHVIGLAYTDYANGQSVMIAEITDCVGAVLPPNQVYYQNAFAGDCEADIRYTYLKSQFEQDIVIIRAPPPPEAYGLPSATTRLECFTEFVEMPEGTRTDLVLKQQPDRNLAAQMVEPDLIDQRLDFGQMRLVTGQAFPLEVNNELHSIPTGKSLEVIEGRTFLIEKADYISVLPFLQQLPQMAAAQPKKVGPAGKRSMIAGILPPRPRGEPGKWKDGQFAKLEAQRKGLVLDYVKISVNTNNVVFQKDTTYFVTAACNLGGTTTFEGGTVIKNTNGAIVNRLSIQGTLVCQTDTYRPAIFTCWTDNTIGETLIGSSGNPSGTHGIYLDFTGNNSTHDIHDVRMRHAYYGLRGDANVTAVHSLRHAQFSSNNTAIAHGSWNVRNALIHDGTHAMVGGNTYTQSFENVTFHRLTNLRSGSYQTALTNCLILAVTGNVVYWGANNVSNSTDTGYFQTVGNAARYLVNRSTNRDAGTTSINAQLRSDLTKLTTYPPIVLSTDFTIDTVLSAQARRDTDIPDIGYHYPPLDYCWTGLKVRDARLTLTNDVAVGLYGAGTSYGIGLDSGGELVSLGLPHRMARILRHDLAQEHGDGACSSSTVAPLVRVLTNAPVTPKLYYRFTESLLPTGYGAHFYSFFLIYDEAFGFRDSYFSSGTAFSTDVGVAVTNCVLDRVFLEIEGNVDDAPRIFNHNLFRGGTLWVSLPTTVPVTAKNNLFDRTTIMQSGEWTHGWNGYYTNLATGQHLTNSAISDKFLTSVGYQTGLLGTHFAYYYPTNGGVGTLTDLVNAGSTDAHLVGFYHYATATNQTKEATSVVDIGFRYPAIDASTGLPTDADADGRWDIFEDLDGDGTADVGETGWQSYNSLFGIGSGPGLVTFTPLKP